MDKSLIDKNERKRLTKLWYSIGQRGKAVRKFYKEDFIIWYSENASKGCHYCGLSQEDSRALAIKLPSARFPISDKSQRGRCRALHLEVDRKKSKGEYSKDNCVLCCYFCNNDKSDVFTHDQYMQMLHGDGWQVLTEETKKENSRFRFLIGLLS
jgi:hypothetical protein